MIKKYTKKQANRIIKKSFYSLGLKPNMKTNPKIIKDILKELKLDDFKTHNKVINKFFKDIITKPQRLQPMFNNIKKGLVSKHPAILEFVELALKKKWFKKSKHVIRSVHVTFILEALTVAMCNNHLFFIEVQDHYKAKEKMFGLNTIHTFSTFLHALSISHNSFNIAKAFSLDPLMIYFRLQRGLSKSHLTKSGLKELYKNRKINYIEYKLLSPIHKKGLEHINELVRINIYEAGVTEYKKGFKTNSISAHELSEDIKKYPPLTVFKIKNVIPENNKDPFYKSIIKKNNLFPVIEFTQDWVSLYITWNMAFILGDLTDLDLIFPKLLIPSIINSESNNFLGARFISLWLSINHVIFRKSDKNEVLGPSNKNTMSKAWGKINKKYAFDLAKRETHEDSKTLKRNYSRFFSHSFYHLLRLIKTFLT
tara:strand:- start:258 stop:1532 length:1275 start_codon:yes stop_codon:yes gene_type:complete